MIRISQMKPFTIGRQNYMLNDRPDNKNTLIYPLTDDPIIFDACLYDLLKECKKVSVRHVQCAYVPRRIHKMIDGVSIRATVPFTDICDRLYSKFKMLKKIRYTNSNFNSFNLLYESELASKLIRERIRFSNDRRFLSFIESIFEDLSVFEEYNKYIIIPLDYVKVPIRRAAYKSILFKQRESSLASLFMLYAYQYPKEFKANMIKHKATIVMYSKFGVFKLSHDDLLNHTIALNAESCKIIPRTDIRLYAESYNIQEDKVADVMLVGARRLKGEGILSDDEFEDSEDMSYFEDEEIDSSKLKEDEDLVDAISDAIGEDITDNPNSVETVAIASDSVDSQITVGIDEEGNMTNVRARILSTDKQTADNIRSEHEAIIVNNLTDANSSEDEVKEAEELASVMTGAIVDNEAAVLSMKRLKQIKLNRTRNITTKEKRYLEKIQRDTPTVQEESELLSDMKLESTTFKNVESFDDMAENSYINFNKTYVDKLKKKDLRNVMNHFSTVKDYPLYATSYSLDDTSDRFNNKETLRIQFKDPEGKSQTVTLDRPILYNGNKFMLNGTQMELQTQRIMKPVILLNGSVMLSFNYNKGFADVVGGRYISKQESAISRFVDKVLRDPELKRKVTCIEFGTVEESDLIEKNVEFTRLGRIMYSIRKDDNNFINFKNSDNIEIFKEIETADNRLIVGKYNGENIYINRDIDRLECGEEKYLVGEFIMKVIEEWESDEAIKKAISSINRDGSTMYSAIKIMSKRIPIIIVLSYTEGLDTILERTGVDYSLIYEDKKPKVDPFEYNLVRFKDCWLKYSIENVESLILFGGLRPYDLSEYTFAEFCDTNTNVVADIIADIGNGNLPLYVSNFEMCFVDPINQEVLKYYDLPTDFTGVLLYANYLLSTDIKTTDLDMRLYRFRNAEIIEALTYKVIADAYTNYNVQKKRGSKTAKLEIPRDALIKAIYEQGNVQTYSVVNPVVSAVSSCKLTVKGLSGLNLDRGITIDKRGFDSTTPGLRALPSVYTGSIGIVNQTPIDPSIVSPRGFVSVCKNDEEVEELSAKKLLSPTELVTMGSTEGDDGQRIFLNFQQKGHVQGILEPSLTSVSNGYDELIGYQAREFVHYAEKDCTVTKITPDFVFVKYDDGTDDVFRLNQVERHAAKAKYLDNSMKLMENIKVGKKLKAQDPIAYNRYMFKEYQGKPIYCLGRVMNVLFMSAPEVYEDATIISESASEYLASYVEKAKVIRFKNNTILKSFTTEIGKKVKASDTLLSHLIMSSDDALNALLANNPDSIDESLVKEKNAGVSGIVKSINVYYCCKKEDLSASIKRFVNAVEAEYIKRGDGDIEKLKASQFTKNRNSRLPIRVSAGTKVANKKVYDGDVIVEYIIQAHSKMSHSDKLTYFNALKGETSKVLPDNKMPKGIISGMRVDCIMSPTSPINRKVTSIIIIGAMERLIYETMRIAKEDISKGKSLSSIRKFILDVILSAEGGDAKTSKNYLAYKETLESLSDAEFTKFVNKGILRVKVVPTEGTFKLDNINKTMKNMIGLPLEERVTIPFLYSDDDIGDIISDKAQTILRIPVIKLMQTALGENRYISSISNRDKSNQVVGESKGGGISDVETSMLLSAGYDSVIKELFTFRADNDIAKKEAYSNIVTKGSTNIPEAPDEGKVALKYIVATYVGMGIDPEFLDN